MSDKPTGDDELKHIYRKVWNAGLQTMGHAITEGDESFTFEQFEQAIRTKYISREEHAVAECRTLETVATLLNGDSNQVEVVKGYVTNKLAMYEQQRKDKETDHEAKSVNSRETLHQYLIRNRRLARAGKTDEIDYVGTDDNYNIITMHYKTKEISDEKLEHPTTAFI